MLHRRTRLRVPRTPSARPPSSASAFSRDRGLCPRRCLRGLRRSSMPSARRGELPPARAPDRARVPVSGRIGEARRSGCPSTSMGRWSPDRCDSGSELSGRRACRQVRPRSSCPTAVPVSGRRATELPVETRPHRHARSSGSAPCCAAHGGRQHVDAHVIAAGLVVGVAEVAAGQDVIEIEHAWPSSSRCCSRSRGSDSAVLTPLLVGVADLPLRPILSLPADAKRLDPTVAPVDVHVVDGLGLRRVAFGPLVGTAPDVASDQGEPDRSRVPLSIQVS